MKTNIRSVALPTTILLLGVLACNASAFPAPQPTVASVVEQPAPAGPISESVTLSSIPLNEENQTPVYKITAQIPFLDGSTDPRVQAFNRELKAIVEQEIGFFKQGTLELPALPISAGSSLDASYELISQKGNIWSMKFNFNGYSDGAAHPYIYSRTVNYDLENGAEVALEELFLPSSNYLQVIADYCEAQLAARDISFDPSFSLGADAAPVNYERWNVSEHGLIITFDASQVAAYAAGPQTVVIPFSELAQVTNDQGPIAPYLP